MTHLPLPGYLTFSCLPLVSVHGSAPTGGRTLLPLLCPLITRLILGTPRLIGDTFCCVWGLPPRAPSWSFYQRVSSGGSPFPFFPPGSPNIKKNSCIRWFGSRTGCVGQNPGPGPGACHLRWRCLINLLLGLTAVCGWREPAWARRNLSSPSHSATGRKSKWRPPESSRVEHGTRWEEVSTFPALFAAFAHTFSFPLALCEKLL